MDESSYTPTVADAREQIIERVKALTADTPESEIAEIVGYLLSRTLVERDGLAFIAMGQSSSLGCYCSLNMLLRKMISAIVDRFDMVVIDAEAGIEQVNRQVIERVDQALLLADGSWRSIQTLKLVRDTAKKIPMMEKCRMGVLFNRVAEIPESHRQALLEAGLPILGFLPSDPAVSLADASRGGLHGLPADSVTYTMISAILDALGALGQALIQPRA